MKKSILRKLKKNRSGFSLVELLFSILILMLSTTVIIQCFNLGIGNFVKVTQASEAQLLCSSLSTAIQNELTYAQDVRVEGDKITYFSNARRMGDYCSLRVAKNDGGWTIDDDAGGEIIIVQDLPNGDGTLPNDDGTKKSKYYPLVSPASYSAQNRAGVSSAREDFLLAFMDLKYDDGKFAVDLWIGDSNHPTKDAALATAKFSVLPIGGGN